MASEFKPVWRWFVYSLSDPESGEIRYVGVTRMSLHVRLAGHIYSAKREKNHRATWIRSLLRRGVRPVMAIIEEGAGEGWQEAERRVILQYRSWGARLVNATEGGEGTHGWHPSVEQRAKMAQRAKELHTGQKRSLASRANMSRAQFERTDVRNPLPPRSAETRERMSSAQRGKKASVETRQKMSKSHSNLTAETREKLRDAVLQRPSEQRAAFASNQKNVPKTEEHKKRIAEALKKSWARRKGVTCG